ncbi:MAG: hypothetical protein PSV16_06465 [Flavobacterium sp.]|nr:hypothetical protein [Flavobacterium sp.]
MKKLLLLGTALLFCGAINAQTKKAAPNDSKSVTVKKDVKVTVETPEVQKNDTKTSTTATKEVKATTVKEGETYKGKTVFKDTKGKRYYLNSNGNKTYIDE